MKRYVFCLWVVLRGEFFFPGLCLGVGFSCYYYIPQITTLFHFLKTEVNLLIFSPYLGGFVFASLVLASTSCRVSFSMFWTFLLGWPCYSHWFCFSPWLPCSLDPKAFFGVEYGNPRLCESNGMKLYFKSVYVKSMAWNCILKVGLTGAMM